MATVYERESEWFIQPSSRTVSGLWIATPPIISLNVQDSRQRKGEAVLEALEASEYSVPVPVDGNIIAAPLLATAQVKSWAQFMKKAKGIQVQLESGRLKIIPYRKVDRKGTQEGITKEAINLSADISPEEIGAALEEALIRCR